MDVCCPLGKNRCDQEKRILYQTQHFFVTPAVGPMGIKGYVLICTKEHFRSIGDIPERWDSELETLVGDTRKVLGMHYSPDIVVFEHGPRIGNYKGGGCIEHAHLHVVPSTVDLVAFLKGRGLQLEVVDGFGKLREIMKRAEFSYLFVETRERAKYVVEVTAPLPSQYLRQVIAVHEGHTNWNWREHPDHETFQRTLEQLRGKF